MSLQEKKKDRKRTRKVERHEGDSPHEESHQEVVPEDDDSFQHVTLTEEEGEASPPQSDADKERRPETGRGIQSSDLSQTQELLTSPTHAKVSQYAKRVAFWLLNYSTSDESGRGYINIDKSWTLIHKVYANNPDEVEVDDSQCAPTCEIKERGGGARGGRALHRYRGC